jgi:sortase A
MSVMIFEGTAPKVLRVAAGHIGGTALPGRAGNIGIAAHRDTLFKPLKDIQHQDKIVLTTSYGTFRYVVDEVEIVDPTDVQVLHATDGPELTLVTCYPFTYLGAAPKRFVVHARQELS